MTNKTVKKPALVNMEAAKKSFFNGCSWPKVDGFLLQCPYRMGRSQGGRLGARLPPPGFSESYENTVTHHISKETKRNK